MTLGHHPYTKPGDLVTGASISADELRAVKSKAKEKHCTGTIMETGVKLRAWRELLRQLDKSRRVGQLARCVGDKTQQAVRSGSLKLMLG